VLVALLSDVTIDRFDEVMETDKLSGLLGSNKSKSGGLLLRIVHPPDGLAFVVNDAVPTA
jgi:hypothetical protein